MCCGECSGLADAWLILDLTSNVTYQRVGFSTAERILWSSGAPVSFVTHNKMLDS